MIAKEKKYLLGKIVIIFSLLIRAGYGIDYISVIDVVKKVKKQYKNLKTFIANFNQQSIINSRKIKYKGKLFYKRPRKLRIEYKFPKGQIVVSDGKIMWIYIPYQKIVGRQELKNQSYDEQINLKLGIPFLFSRYSYKFGKEEQPVFINNKWYYTIILTSKHIKKNFKRIKLWVSKSSYIIEKMIGQISKKKKIIIEFSNIEINKEISDDLFIFRVPKGVYVYNNPIGW